MLFRYTYNTILLILAFLYLPIFLFQLIRYNKYRKSFFHRLGFYFPKMTPSDKKVIWVHAVSVGETRAVAPFIRRLKSSEDVVVILSCVTETGFAEGERVIPEADYHVYLPFDLSWIVRPILKRVKPDRIVICETDYWMNFLSSAKDYGADITVINGKISEKSTKFFLKFPSICSKIFPLVDHYCVQSEVYADRFARIGIPKDKMIITGNIKFDFQPHDSKNRFSGDLSSKLGITKGSPIIVAGSTHEPEEALLIDAMAIIWNRDPSVNLVLVPRHPERFHHVAALLTKRDIPFRRYSNGGESCAKVVLVDTMGILNECYQLATIAVVGGSFTDKVGGHNIMEPCTFAIPVVYGPFMYSQPDMATLISEGQAGKQVSSDQLSDTLNNLLMDSQMRKLMGESGQKIAQSSSGAADRTFDAFFCKKGVVIK